MIDKQIINEMIEEIGFDVQQCGYLEIIKDAPNYPEIGGTFTDFECNLYSRECKFIERCRYKQLLCKEKKYEELKKQLIDFMNEEHCANSCSLKQQLDQLKVENEHLKNFYINLLGVKECEIRELLILKQAFAEIKDIAEENIRISELEGLNGVYRRGLAEQILQKISEVTENENS